mmetsp:Transcript_22739/g.42064  ORF Transcript_22739/g.42064 Transcript_22739/m.42064 type:complete len:155 (-) Transcript_22739:21-485(-)
MVHIATYLLCTSAYVAITLTAFMFWIFLVNRRGLQQFCHVHFAAMIILGLLLPLFYVIWQWCRGQHRLNDASSLADLRGAFASTEARTPDRAAAAAEGMRADTLATSRPGHDSCRDELLTSPEQEDARQPASRRQLSLRAITEVVARPFSSGPS